MLARTRTLLTYSTALVCAALLWHGLRAWFVAARAWRTCSRAAGIWFAAPRAPAATGSAARVCLVCYRARATFARGARFLVLFTPLARAFRAAFIPARTAPRRAALRYAPASHLHRFRTVPLLPRLHHANLSLACLLFASSAGFGYFTVRLCYSRSHYCAP